MTSPATPRARPPATNSIETIATGLGVVGVIVVGVLAGYSRLQSQIQRIFNLANPNQQPSVASTPTPLDEPADTRQVTLTAVGDIMLGRQVYINSLVEGDFTWPFHETASLLQQSDLALGNLESPLVTNCELDSKGMRLCAQSSAVQGLQWAGFDLLSVANNHALDYGEEGFADTLANLQGVGIATIGGNLVVIREIDDIAIGVMAFEDTTEHPLDLSSTLSATQEMNTEVDVLITVMHWGVEYHDTPSERQQEVGHALIDSGADMIIGAHPHWVQPVEEYHGGLIFYSLGNFVFDQMWSPETRRGNILRLSISRDGNATFTI